MTSELAHAWRINCGMNHMLLEALEEEALGDRYSPRTRSVSSQFAHMHNIRLVHLEKRFREIEHKLTTFGRGAEPSRPELVAALKASDRLIGQALSACEASGKVRSWKGPPASFLSYFVAHEAHHRGLTLVCMRVAGRKAPKDVGYGMWYWSKDWAKDWDDSWED